MRRRQDTTSENRRDSHDNRRGRREHDGPIVYTAAMVVVARECTVVPMEPAGGRIGIQATSQSTLVYVTSFKRIKVVRRRIYHTVVFAALAVMAAPAIAQHIDAPQRVRQRVYEAANGPAYAAQYAQTADGYVAPGGYDAYQDEYYPGGSPPPAAAIEQVSNLTYQPAPATPEAASVPGGDYDNCGSCCTTSPCRTCCDPYWAHYTGIYGEWLYLRVRNDGVANSLPQNGIGPGAVPFGTVATNSPTYQPEGFRVGVSYAMNRYSSLWAGYTYWQGISNGSTFTNPPLVVHSLVTLPQTGTAASDGVAALSRLNVRFQFADVEYRRLIAGGANWYVNYAVGARYANLQQLFSQAQVNGPTQTGVTSRIGMDAAGSRVGLIASRKCATSGFFFYGNAFADILVGNFRSNYQQVNNFQQTQVLSSWKDFRPVPILEYELGAGWQSKSGRFRVSGGYYFACWFNTVSTSNYIQAVQTNNYVNIGNAITFDGLVLRGQYNY